MANRVILRGRPDIVGALCDGFPRFLGARGDTASFPRRLTAAAATATAAAGGLSRMLAECGALHLTGAPARTVGDFQQLLDRLGLASVEYRGGLGHRTSESSLARVYSASDEPAGFTIETHNEKADTPDLPDVISFWCQVPAEPGNGGETVLLHSDAVLNSLDAGVLRKLEEKRICYWRRLKHKREADYLSWQSVFRTDDKTAVESYLSRKQFNFQWDSCENSLTYWNVLPPTKSHPITGRKVWCNSIQSHHESYYSVHPTYRLAPERFFTTYYGDQSPIEDWVLQHIRQVSWAGAIGFQLARHEMIIADNHLVQHGRMSFRGDRKLKVVISRPWTKTDNRQD